MSLRHYHATAIDCNGPSCFEVYVDTCEVRDDQLRKFARRDGWSEDGQGRHYCPACTAKQRPTTATPQGVA